MNRFFIGFKNKVAGFLLKTFFKKLKNTSMPLIQIQKMSNIEQLLGGFVHDINSPLGCILNNAEMLNMDLTEPDHKESLSFIIDSVAKCKLILERLSKYSKKATSSFESVDVSKAIEETCAILGYQARRNSINIHREKGSCVPFECCIFDLEHIFSNIIINAIDAILSKCDGIKRTGNITIKNYCSDNYHIIEILDDGPGISEKYKNKIFDPFFTTKYDKNKLGLGLYIAREIIGKYNGSIQMESNIGKGALFTIRFPLKPL